MDWFPCYSNIGLTGFLDRLGRPSQNAKDVVFAHDKVLRALKFGVAARVLSKKDAVADFDVEGNQFAILEPFATPNSNDFAFLRLLLGRIGDDDAVARGFLFLDPLYHDAVV